MQNTPQKSKKIMTQDKMKILNQMLDVLADGHLRIAKAKIVVQGPSKFIWAQGVSKECMAKFRALYLQFLSEEMIPDSEKPEFIVTEKSNEVQ